MPTPDPIIRTKIHLPFIRPSLVPRPELQARILSGLCGPLTLVIAPAGFGKTTLVAASIANCRKPVAWLSLDLDDNQPGRFLSYLAAAIRGTDRRIGVEAAQLLEEIQQPPPEAVLTSLVNDIDSSGSELVLALDDYQFISSSAVHAAVAFLLEHCPPALHVLIASRSDPSLPLARLRARGQMVELRSADLRFSAVEAAKFLNEVMGLSLDAEAVATLEQRTEGWIAGLQMAALSMRERKDVRGFIDGFSGTNRHILDYLLEEILASQPAEIQSFLLQTSVLERLTAPLCDAVLEAPLPPIGGAEPTAGTTPDSSSSSYLEYLERENLFLVSLDDERAWFRYHHLFSDLLRARLRQTRPDLLPRLHKQASAWLEKSGDITGAVHHLFAALETERAVDMIETYGPARWAEGDASIIQMADQLPVEMAVSRPRIGLNLAWFLLNQGNVEKTLRVVNGIEQQLSTAASADESYWMRTMVALFIAFLSRENPLPSDQEVEEIPTEEPILRDASEVLYGMALGRRGDFRRAELVALRCMEREKTHPSATRIPSMVPFLATIYVTQGRLHAAAALCREYLAGMRARGIQFLSAIGNMNVVLGQTLYEQNFLDEAEQVIREGLRTNLAFKNIMSDALGLLVLAHILRTKGDFDGALEIVSQFENRLETEMRPGEFQEDFHTLRIRVQLTAGDLESAGQWAEQIQRSEDYHLHEQYYLFTLGRIFLAQQKYADVEKITAKINPQPGMGGGLGRQLDIQMLQALALAGQRRMPEAFVLLETSLSQAETEGYVRSLIDHGEPARDLLSAYHRSYPYNHKAFVDTLIGSFTAPSSATPSGPQSSGLVEALSERELEVLQLIALGRTNQEIARQLVVAPGTIKAHTASIYRKLDVANRTEAVSRARQLSILA